MKRKRSSRRAFRSKRRRVSRKFKRSYGRRRGYARRMAVYHYKRYATTGCGDYTITGAAGYAPYQGAQVYKLSDVVNVSEFTNLYDQFRINKVVTKFWLQIDPSAQTAATATWPKIYMHTDKDDNNVATLDEMRERQNIRIRVLTPNRPVSIAFRPCVLMAGYESAVATCYVPKAKQWLDIVDSATAHYALKFCIDDLTNTNYKVNVESIIYFSCKGVR